MGLSLGTITDRIDRIIRRLPLAWFWRRGTFTSSGGSTVAPRGEENGVIFFEDTANATGHLLIRKGGKTYRFNSDEVY